VSSACETMIDCVAEARARRKGLGLASTTGLVVYEHHGGRSRPEDGAAGHGGCSTVLASQPVAANREAAQGP